MRIKDISVPDIYTDSADFRFFLRWFELALSKVQYDTEHGLDLYDPEKCPANVDLMSMIDYSNEKHIEALLSYQGSTSDLGNDIAIILYDVNKALKTAFEKNLIDINDLEIIKFLRKGKSKEWIAKKKNISSRTVYRRLEKTSVAVKGILNGKKII